MQTAQLETQSPSEGSGLPGVAFGKLLKLPADADKSQLMSTIDNAVTEILCDLVNHEESALPAENLNRVKVTLGFLEQCLSFKDKEFTGFARKRAQELETALIQTLERIEAAKKKTPDTPDPTVQAKEAVKKPPETEAKDVPDVPEEKAGFQYEREETLLIKFAWEKLSKRLQFLRGDSVKVVKRKQVPVSGLNHDGVPPIFFMSPELPEILCDPFAEMLREKRDLLERRVYIFTTSDMSDQEVLNLYEETYRPDIMMIVAMEFDNWAGEMAKAGIAGLPQERQSSKKATDQSQEEGIGASLKKVFSFGAKKEKKAPKVAKAKIPDTLAVRTHKAWQALENKGVFYLSQHFSFSILSYLLNMNEKQFDAEYVTICQIVDQQEEADVGPVITNLSRLYKFHDNIFFDLVILVLFHRNNKFDINMLQAACMSQNFVVDRLPLTMDELRRRPMEHAKHILKTLTDPADKEEIEKALTDYFYVHETVHSNKVGKRIQASESLLKRQGDKLDEKFKKVTDGIDEIVHEINTLKARQEEQGVYLGEEIQAAIDAGIQKTVAHL